MTAPLDEVDRRLVAELQRDARASLTDLARAIHLGVSATRARLRALEERGVVTGYTARVDPAAAVDGCQAVAVAAAAVPVVVAAGAQRPDAERHGPECAL